MKVVDFFCAIHRQYGKRKRFRREPDIITLVNVYVDLVVFTRIAGTS